MALMGQTPVKVQHERNFPILFHIRDVFQYANTFIKAQLSFAPILQVSSDCSSETKEACAERIAKDLAQSYFLTHRSDKTHLSLDFTHSTQV